MLDMLLNRMARAACQVLGHVWTYWTEEDWIIPGVVYTDFYMGCIRCGLTREVHDPAYDV